MRTISKLLSSLLLITGLNSAVTGQSISGNAYQLSTNENALAFMHTMPEMRNARSTAFAATAALDGRAAFAETPFVTAVPGRTEAESYASMTGVQTETTLDAGGGLNVGWIDNGDWMDYSVNVAASGNYAVSFRISTPNTGQQLLLKKSDGTILATVNLPQSGGWQSWVTTNPVVVALTAGTQTIRIYSNSSGWNFNWMDFATYSGNLPPTANAGSAQTIMLPTSSVTLTGSGTDPDGTISAYAWSLVSGPNTPSFTAASSATTSVTGLIQGTYVFRLTVTDNQTATATNDVTVTVNANITPPSVSTSNQSVSSSTASLTSTINAPFALTSTKWTKFAVPGQTTKRLTIVGSSTSAGYAASVNDSGYASKLKVYYKAQGIIDTIYNLAVPGTSIFDVDITTALNKGGQVLLVNYPSNAYDGSTYTVTQICQKYQQVMDSCTARGVQFYTTGTQPRNDFAPADRVKLNVINDSLRLRFGSRFIDFLKPVLNTADNSIITQYSAGDGIHENDLGHEAFFQIVKAANIFQNVATSSSVISTPASQNTSVTSLGFGVHKFQISVVDNRGLAASAVAQVTYTNPNAPNTPPVAKAGADQTINLPTSSVSLSGTASTDDHNIVAYQWTKLTGTGGTLTTPTASTTTFTGLTTGVYTIELRVTDDSSAVARDTVQITVNSNKPIPGRIEAETFDSQSGVQTENTGDTGGGLNVGWIDNGDWMDYLVFVQATGTYTVNFRVASPNAGAQFQIKNGATILTTVNIPNTGGWQTYQTVSISLPLTAGLQTLRLFSNGAGWNFNWMDFLSSANQAPVARAGADKAITLPVSSVSLDGTASTDDHNIIAYQWTKLTGTGGSLTTPTAATTTFTGLTTGTYSIELKVTDDSSAVSRDTVLVTVYPPLNQAPVAKAGADQVITLPVNSVALSGTASTDDHNIVAYQWTKLTGTGGTLSTPAVSTTNFTGLTAGVYTVELRVTDDSSAVSRDTVQITVNPPLNQPPVANAGADKVITLPVNSVALSGTASTDDHNIVAYQWTKITGNGGALSTPAASTTNFTGLTAGVYTVELRVTDDSSAVSRDTVQITVNPPLNVPPVANAGADQSITLPTSSVNLSGSASTDDHNIVAYQWTKLTGTGGTLSTPNAVNTSFTGLSAGVYTVELQVTDDSSAVSRDTVQITVIPNMPNVAPVARAGADKVITLPVNSVALNGIASTDDHNIVAYQWTKLTGNGGTLSTPSASTTNFTGLTAGVYTVELAVTDDSTAVGRDTVQITVYPPLNQPPVAKAGADQVLVMPNSTASLNGTASTDDYNIVSYQWTKLTGTGGTLNTPNAATTTFSGLTAGIYTVELKVTDDSSAVARDTMQITVFPPPNQAPVANAGADKVITLPVNSVALSGTASTDDHNIVAYQWTKLTGAGGTLSTPAASTTNFTGLTAGIYTVELRVTDDSSAVARDTVQITVNPPLNQPPVANAGADIAIALPATSVNLSGTASTDDHNIISYQWTKISGTGGTLTTPNASATSFTGLSVGVYKVELKVTDDSSAVSRDTVQITVNNLPNQPPVANAGPDQTIQSPVSSVTLNGTGSTDDRTIVSYLWTKLTGTGGTLATPTASTTTFSGLTTGVYTVELKVTDDSSAVRRDTVQITVLAGSIIDPSDVLVTYNSASPPTEPAYGTIGKWVRTVRLTWNTSSWKAYIINGIPFRIKFPKTYVPGVNDGKKYPMLLFLHGLGETGTKYDNEFSMANGGPIFNDAVNNGVYDGYILIPQAPAGGWASSHLVAMKLVIDYMVQYNKLDPFRIVDNGLSNGGFFCWDQTLSPDYLAARMPMSGIALANINDTTANKFTPIWDFQGGLDVAPDPNNAKTVYNTYQSIGANMKFTLYPNLGHGTWSTAWAEPDFFPYALRAYSANPWPLFGRTDFCVGDAINVTMGVNPGFAQYEWRKDGVLIPGANTNKITVTQTGTYDARVRKGTNWSEWSRVPVVIKYKTAVAEPPITTSGLMSRVIPALDTALVTLKVPDGYTSYLWQKVGNNTTIGTDSALVVSTPGDYQVKVTEQYGCTSAFSPAFTVVDANGPNKPDAPTSLNVSTISANSLRLDWNQNPTPQFNETNFEIYQSLQSGGPYKLVAITGADVTNYTVTGLTNAGSRYYFKVRAVNNTAASAASNEASAVTTADTQAPTVPASLTSIASTRTSVTLSWTASTDNVGVIAYDVYVGGVKSFTTTNTIFTVNDLTFQQTYAFTVKARDLAGNVSAASNQITAEPLLQNLNYKYYTYVGSWPKLPDFTTLTPDATGATPNVDITLTTQPENYAFLWEGYIIIPTTGTYQFRTSSDDGSRIWLGSLNGTVSPYNYASAGIVSNDGLHGTTTVTSSSISLTAGLYPIAIAYYNETGGAAMNLLWRTPSTGSSYVTVPNSAFNDSPVSNGSAPADPTNLNAVAVSYKQINVSWSDNSNNETGFEIWRSTNASSGFTVINQVPANTVSYADSSLTGSTTYYYRIKALGQFAESNLIENLNTNITEAKWLFNNNAYDSSGNGRTLTPVGTPTYDAVNKKEGTHAVSLNGTTQSMTIPATSSWLQNSYSQKTIAFWMRSASNTGSRIVADIGGSDDGLALMLNSNTLIAGVASNNSRSSFSTPYTSTGWNHIALVYKSNSLVLYVNGVQANSNNSLSFTSLGTTTNGSAIGRVNGTNALNTGTGFFSGQIDYFMVYNEALTAADVNNLMNNQAFYQSFATTPALPAVPATPTALSDSVINANSIKVKWTDNANNEDAYEIYRSATNNLDYVKLATLLPNTVMYTDTTLFANATYYYKVRAVNAGGPSAYSNEASAVTLNHAPVITDLADKSIRYGITTDLSLAANDQDGEALTFSVQNLPAFGSLLNGGGQPGTIRFTPAITDQGTYNGIKVIVTDAHGAKDTTTFNLTVNDNYDPVLNAIANYNMNESDTVNINLSATDLNPADVLTMSVTGLPNNYTLTPGSNGNAVLQLRPTFAAAGTYTVQVTVTDGKGGSATQQFTLTVADKDPTVRIYTRIKYANTIGAPWNSLLGPTTNNLVDEKNNVTSTGVVFQQPFWLPYNAGPVTGNNSGVYPDAVLNDFWYFGYYGGPETASLKVTGLSPAGKYNLTFYAGSVFNGVSDNGTTNYTVGAKTVSLNVQNNTTNTVSVNDIIPAPDGTITVNMAKAAGTPIGYLNAMIITKAYDDGTAPAAPVALALQNVSGQGVRLNWQDVAFNDTAYEVYRSLNQAGPYTLIGTTARDAQTYMDGTVSGGTTYYYRVRATNWNGTSGYSNVASITTINRIPQISPISDIVVKNNQTATVNVTAVDDPGDHITLTASGLPSFATFVDNGNGTGVINVTPSLSSLGAYTGVTITAKDNSDSSRTVTFNIFVVDANITSTYVNITDGITAAPSPWNNMAIGYLPFAGTSISGLMDDNNVNTGISMTLTEGWTGVSTTGMRRRNGTDLYPENVSRAGIYITDTTTHHITISGLNPAKKYNFVFFSSHNTSESTLTNFTINTSTVSLNGCHNSNKTAQINGVIPPASGTVVINVKKGTGANAALLSAMVIQSYTPGVVTVFGPTDLRVLDYGASNAINLQWQDRADNETGYEVWRAPEGGSYSLLTTLAANTTSYSNTGLAANTTYSYIVRAKTASAFSSYSNPVRWHTYATAVFINVSSNAQAASPWNNLNWIYGVNAIYNNFKNESGVPTNIGLIQPVKIDGMIGGGVNTGNNSGVFPDAVLSENWGLFPGLSSYIKLTGLNLSRLYDITLTASITNVYGDNTTAYTINGKTCLLNSINNKDGSLTMFGINPDQNGEITISFTTYQGATWALMGAIIVKGYTPVTQAAPVPPGNAINSATMSLTTEDVAAPATTATTAIETPVAYPNPFNSSFDLVVPTTDNDAFQVVLNDLSGRTLYTKQFSGAPAGSYRVRIETADMHLSTGVYFANIRYTKSGIQRTVKLIKR